MPNNDEHWSDPLFKLRYGVGYNEKNRLALSGEVPGAAALATVDTSDEMDDENRRTSAYLFGQKWPTVGPILTEVANTIRFMDPASRRQLASDAVQRGAADARAGSNLVAQREKLGQAPIASAADQVDYLRTPSPTLGSREY